MPLINIRGLPSGRPHSYASKVTPSGDRIGVTRAGADSAVASAAVAPLGTGISANMRPADTDEERIIARRGYLKVQASSAAQFVMARIHITLDAAATPA